MSEQLWKDYLKATAEREERPLLKQAIMESPGSGHALDLGCGAGGDTLALLQQGFRVLSVDALEDALVHTRQRAEAAGLAEGLQTRHSRFEHLSLEPATYQLISAGFSLPFCPRPAFDGLWAAVLASLDSGGVFVGQFFGDRDSWANDTGHPSSVFVARAELDRCLAGLEVIRLDEEEERRATALGGEKDWHLFHIIARSSTLSMPLGPSD